MTAVTSSSPNLPLAGVRVLDLGQIYAGGYASLLLAMAGADVIKVEPPGGENLRRRGAVGGGAYPFAMLNSNKRAIVVDLKTEEGRDLLTSLASHCDVLVENFKPGVMDRLGVGRDVIKTVNPDLIFVSSSGYGRDSDYSGMSAMDLTVQAVAGVMSTTGFPDAPPVKAGPAIVDFLTGVHVFAGICASLYGRERTHAPTPVEVTMQESVYPSLMSSLGLYFANEESNGADNEGQVWRTGNRHSGYAESPYNVYAASDGYFAVICVTDGHWLSLAELIGGTELQSDSRFRTLAGRVDLMDDLDEIVGHWARGFTRAELHRMLGERGVPCAPIKELPEVVNDPNLWKRRMLQKVDHPDLGEIVGTSSPIRFGDGPRGPLAASPQLGQHTREVLTEMLSLSTEQIDELEQKGAIRCAAKQS
ncbi:CaiB/BaiF CoA transferase family protein [Aeromicrobium sp. CTD01-1L150]|uniref:CaiB/BaiF CoA transferase family protein n=1 Tax=Aeromicrobium sp. CTD01-1L150 TaxID=3341830 RepID=UPI0035C232E7